MKEVQAPRFVPYRARSMSGLRPMSSGLLRSPTHPHQEYVQTSQIHLSVQHFDTHLKMPIRITAILMYQQEVI